MSINYFHSIYAFRLHNQFIFNSSQLSNAVKKSQFNQDFNEARPTQIKSNSSMEKKTWYHHPNKESNSPLVIQQQQTKSDNLDSNEDSEEQDSQLLLILSQTELLSDSNDYFQFQVESERVSSVCLGGVNVNFVD